MIVRADRNYQLGAVPGQACQSPAVGPRSVAGDVPRRADACGNALAGQEMLGPAGLSGWKI